MPRFLFAGPRPDELAGGRPVAPLEVLNLTRAQAAENARLIRKGQLVELPKTKTQENT